MSPNTGEGGRSTGEGPTDESERIRARLESVTDELRDLEEELGRGLSVREAIHHVEAVERAVDRLERDGFEPTDEE